MLYGYARVSSADQNEDRQIVALTAAGVQRNRIFVDKKSGASFDRPQYKRLLRNLKKGDILFIQSIDRLGRNYIEVQKQWYLLTKKKHIDISVISMPLLDTRQDKNLMGMFISDVVLQLLSFIAETERNNIRERQAQGIAVAKAKGKRFGRPRKPLPDNFEEIAKKVLKGEISKREGARRCNMPLSTFTYKLKKTSTTQ